MTVKKTAGSKTQAKSAQRPAEKVETDHAARARETVENGMDMLTGKAREAWETVQERVKSVRDNAGETLGAIRTSFETAGAGMRDINMKLIDVVTADANTYFTTMRKIATAKSMKEAFEIQSGYMRSQFQTNMANARAVGELAQGTATQSFKPLREKVMSFAKMN